MTGTEIIERARRAQRQRHGIRVKVRIPTAIWHRVREAASVCKTSNEEYVNLICRAVESERIRVTLLNKLEIGTFSEPETETVWIRCPVGFDTSALHLRSVLIAGCYITEASAKKMQVDTDTPTPIEGVDYLLEGKSYPHVAMKGKVK